MWRTCTRLVVKVRQARDEPGGGASGAGSVGKHPVGSSACKAPPTVGPPAATQRAAANRTCAPPATPLAAQDAAKQLGSARRTTNETLGALTAAAAALSSVGNGSASAQGVAGAKPAALWDIQVHPPAPLPPWPAQGLGGGRPAGGC